jgi:hypothetical protein
MNKNDRVMCSKYFELRLSTDIFKSSNKDIETDFITNNYAMKRNLCLQKALGDDYLSMLNDLFAVELENFSRDIFNLTYDGPRNIFFEFVKQSYNDLCICWSEERDYSNDGERTFFCELFIQQFKLFSKITKLLKFKWAEKKINNRDTSWLAKKDYNKKEIQIKLLDGLGTLKKMKLIFL